MQPIPEPLIQVADQTRSAFERVTRLSANELRGMVDALASLLLDDATGTARIPANLPLVRVMPTQERWVVMVHDHGGEAPARVFDSKKDALDLARDLARQQDGTLVIHRADASIQRTYHYLQLSTGVDGGEES